MRTWISVSAPIGSISSTAPRNRPLRRRAGEGEGARPHAEGHRRALRPARAHGADRRRAGAAGRRRPARASPSATSAKVASIRFICGVPMKLATKTLAGLAKIVVRRGDLLDEAVAHDGDAVGHGQRLELVVGDDHRRLGEAGQHLLDLAAHRLAQLDVEAATAARRRGSSWGRARWRAPPRRAASRPRRSGPAGGRAPSVRSQRLGDVARRAARARPPTGARSRAGRRCSRRPSAPGRARRTGTPSRCRAAPGAQVVHAPAGDDDVARRSPARARRSMRKRRGLAAARGAEQADHLARRDRRGRRPHRGEARRSAW